MCFIVAFSPILASQAMKMSVVTALKDVGRTQSFVPCP
jgi:hypothetical protein